MKISVSNTSQTPERFHNTFKHIADEFPYYFKNTEHKNADILIEFAYTYNHLYKIKPQDRKRTVVILNAPAEQRPLMRCGRFVDDPQLLSIRKIKKILDECKLVFTTLDINPNLHKYCLVPLSFNDHSNISQKQEYWLESPDEFQKVNCVFWSGSTWTHKSREIINQLIEMNDPRFELNAWKPKTSSGEKASVYGSGNNKPDPNEYINYINKLNNSSLTLVIRGDKPWVFSFLDTLRTNTVPIFIDAGYPELGWENINYDPSNLFLSFDTSSTSTKSIKEGIDKLLNDRKKIDLMRNSVSDFYDTFIKNDLLYKRKIYDRMFSGWMNFYAAKLIQVYETEDTDVRFFSKSIWNLLGKSD